MRCYNCQRLKHAREVCPLLLKARQDKASAIRLKVQSHLSDEKLVLKKADPLFGVLKEEQVGVNPITGRLKIAPQVLEETRRYLMADNGDDLSVKKERVKATIAKAESDPEAQRATLRLEARPIVTSDVDKGKGRLFDFENSKSVQDSGVEEKLLSGALKVDKLMMERLGFDDLRSKLELSKAIKSGFPSATGFTEYGSCFSEAGPSGAMVVTGKSRKRQVKRLRKIYQSKDGFVCPSADFKRHGKGVMAPKRKSGTQADARNNILRRKNQKVIPREGSPNI